MCCLGCATVAKVIVNSGNENYYQYRDVKAQTGESLVPEFIKKTQVYDHPSVQKQFVFNKENSKNGSVKQVSLILEGITCAACLWLNEQYIGNLDGVVSAEINYSTHRARVEWDDSKIQLSEILQGIAQIGYLAHPYDAEKQQQIYEKSRKQLIRRVGVAGILGMQVMTFALALYGGDWWGISENFKQLFRWLSLLLTLPVLLYSAQPFFKGAWTDLKNKRAGMDVPVVLGLSIAFISSTMNTFNQVSDVYYDSVVMFVFLLLSVRLFELSARKKALEKIESLTNLTPTMSNRILADGSTEVVPTVDLEINDELLVRPGETIPSDGQLLTENALVDEALLTGEQHAVAKKLGENLIGGSINLEQPLKLLVTQIGQDTVLSGIQRLIEQAQSYKPEMAKLADRIASKFVIVLLFLVTITAIAWWFIEPEKMLSVIVATLVVTCPCALSLATPATLSAAIGSLTRLGMLVSQSSVLEKIPNVDTVIFDKTGTLTQGNLSLTRQWHCQTEQQQYHQQLAKTLESQSEHPIAKALLNFDMELLKPSKLENHVGKGISATINDTKYVIGNAQFINQSFNIEIPDQVESVDQLIHLASEHKWLASFEFNDPLREDATEVVQQLQKMGKSVQILSGDRQASVEHIASQLGLDCYRAEQLPANKMQYVQQLQQQGINVAMVGDGVNDAPVLATADISISMAQGTTLAKSAADLVLNSQHLQPIVDAFKISTKMMQIIRQNFTWAIGYNIVAIPFAMAGLIQPWLAAIGMSLSSLLVVLNSLRLR